MAEANGQYLPYVHIIKLYGSNRKQHQHAQFINRFCSFGHDEKTEDMEKWLVKYLGENNIHIHHKGTPVFTISEFKEAEPHQYAFMVYQFEITFRKYPEGENLEYDCIWNFFMENVLSAFSRKLRSKYK